MPCNRLALFSFVSVLLFILFGFNVNLASATGPYNESNYDSGCTSAGPYSTKTGQLCSNPNPTAGCLPGYSFSPLTGQPCNNSQTTRCPILLNREFEIGERGNDIKTFQQTLKDEGFFSGKVDGIYGPITDGASANYYRRCPRPIPPPISPGAPVIKGVDGPQSLNVNQQGTWTVTASSPSGGNLSYDVDWGDNFSGMPGGFGQMYDNTIHQSATFTHSYQRAGIYTPIFTVTNESGQNAQTSLSVNVGNGTNSSPTISLLSPTSGVVGTQVTVHGSGFTSTDNSINFSNIPYAIIGLESSTGSTLSFTIPSQVCNQLSGSAIMCLPTPSGTTYSLSVRNTNGTSNSLNFTVTSK